MLLRPRQKLFVERSLAALSTHKNTLGVAPTASGKSVMLSAVAGDLLKDPHTKACVLAHRDELTDQNRTKFSRVNPSITTSVFDANEKSWAGQATFAMAPTLCRPANLEAMPALDLLVIDEAHHAVADSYRRIIDRAVQRNPAVKIFGVTATPNRGDKQGLREVFSNVSDQIRIGELIAAGHLVQPRTFVIDVGVQEKLKAVRKKASDFDMSEVDAIMNKSPVTDSVIENWKAKAANRQTVVFCSTVKRRHRWRRDLQGDRGLSRRCCGRSDPCRRRRDADDAPSQQERMGRRPHQHSRLQHRRRGDDGGAFSASPLGQHINRPLRHGGTYLRLRPARLGHRPLDLQLHHQASLRRDR